jgi:hypothetical protein
MHITTGALAPQPLVVREKPDTALMGKDLEFLGSHALDSRIPGRIRGTSRQAGVRSGAPDVSTYCLVIV